MRDEALTLACVLMFTAMFDNAMVDWSAISKSLSFEQ